MQTCVVLYPQKVFCRCLGPQVSKHGVGLGNSTYAMHL